jgi:hypothetical protein
MRRRSQANQMAMNNDFSLMLLAWMKKHKPTELEMLVLFSEHMSISVKHLLSLAWGEPKATR